MKFNRFVFAVAFLGIATTLFSADHASAQGAAGNALGFDSGEEDKNPPFPMNMMVSLSHSMGQGTFLLNPATDTTSDHGIDNTSAIDYSSNALVSSFASITIIAKLSAIKATLLFNQGFELEWTQSDATNYANQVVYYDPAARVLWNGSGLGFRFQYGPGMSIPLSMSSRYAGYQTRMNMRFGALRNFGGFILNMLVQPGVNLYIPSELGQVSDSGQYDDRRLKTVNPANCILRENAEVANFACNGGTPNLYSVGSRVTLFYNGFKNWSIGSALGLNLGWNLYDAPLDYKTPIWRSVDGMSDTSADAATSNGGRNYTMSTSGGLSATYTIKNMYLTLGTSSGQSLWTADGNGYRFPFWDFISPANNLSSVYVDTTWFF
jgi:hypothetical protein